jgi:hypothetical protein
MLKKEAQRVLNDLQRIRLSRMIWLLSHTRPPPRHHVVSLSQSYSVSLVELTDGRGGKGWERSQIIRRRESGALNKSFSILCYTHH